MGKQINYGVEYVNTHVHHTQIQRDTLQELQLRASVWTKLKKDQMKQWKSQNSYNLQHHTSYLQQHIWKT